jgi:hypothetical protein
MTITRRLAAAAILAGVAVGTASTALADQPTMSGHYVKTASAVSAPPGTPPTTSDWYATPCGDGCASISDPGGVLGQAQLVNGQWTMDATTNAQCVDGSQVPSALSVHYTWDPNTLAGSSQTTAKVPECGQSPGYQQTNNLQLRQTP